MWLNVAVQKPPPWIGRFLVDYDVAQGWQHDCVLENGVCINGDHWPCSIPPGRLNAECLRASFFTDYLFSWFHTFSRGLIVFAIAYCYHIEIMSMEMYGVSKPSMVHLETSCAENKPDSLIVRDVNLVCAETAIGKTSVT